MTKQITAVATLMLVEDHRLRLDEAVDKWLPELANRKVLKHVNGPIDETVSAYRAITIEDLLTCRMGTGMVLGTPDEYLILKAIEEAGIVGFGAPEPLAPHSPDEWIRRLGELPLMHQPGEEWMYNTCFYVLGVLIARVSGLPLEAFLKERIFDPLGMKDTGFSVSPSQLSRLTSCYYFNSEIGELELADDRGNSQWGSPPIFPDAGAGLVSTIDDYFAFAKMLLNGGKIDRLQRLLSKSSVDRMTRDHLTPIQKQRSSLYPGQWDQHGYGLGVSVVTEPGSETGYVGEYGWDGGYGSSWRTDPLEKRIGILFTERTFDAPSLPAVCRDFWTAAYQR